ncbi:hypothetical protein D3C84_925540 [compost metagenome]
MVDETVEEHCARRLGGTIATMVVDVVERLVFIHQFEVVPVLAAHKGATVTVLQLQIVDAFENFREGFAFLEVESAVVSVSRRRVSIGAH